MKLLRALPPHRSREHGFFLVIVMLIIASVMLIYIAANGNRLISLRKEIGLVEQKQVARLNLSAIVTTNPPAQTISPGLTK